jgi:hypothetical protein
MEEQKKEIPLMKEEEFKDYLIDNRSLKSFNAVSKFKSVKRAIRRGHMSAFGQIYPRRPFNNRANTSSRKGIHSRVHNELCKKIYAEYKSKIAV